MQRKEMPHLSFYIMRHNQTICGILNGKIIESSCDVDSQSEWSAVLIECFGRFSNLAYMAVAETYKAMHCPHLNTKDCIERFLTALNDRILNLSGKGSLYQDLRCEVSGFYLNNAVEVKDLVLENSFFFGELYAIRNEEAYLSITSPVVLGVHDWEPIRFLPFYPKKGDVLGIGTSTLKNISEYIKPIMINDQHCLSDIPVEPMGVVVIQL